MDEGELIVVRDDRETYNDYDGYLETSGDLVTEATGELRRLVLAKVDNIDPGAAVKIIEEHWNSGFCETCSSPETDFKIEVDGETVFDTQGDGWRAKYEANPYTTFSVLQWWLTNETEEED